jgi:hypothetical protein
MTLRRLACVLVAAPAFVYFAAAQLPAPPSPLAPPPPVVASPFPAVSSSLTPAAPVSAPISAPPSPVGIAPYPPPPGGPTLWSFLGMSYQQREYRQRQMARTPIGKIREKIQTPLSKLTKGIIPPFPPKTPSLAELQAPGPVGAAAKLKLDRAAAGERVKAVKELGTADCHYWPEAEDALVGALRNDRNEWVRLAAAETLGQGCCCTKKTIVALTNACTCSSADGAPAEKSPRVVAAACAALERCLNAVCATPIVSETVVPEGPREGTSKEGTTQASWSKPGPAGGEEKSSGGLPPGQMARPTVEEYYARVATRPWSEVVEYAKRGAAASHRIPQELFLTGGGYEEVETARGDRPKNLLDALLGDDAPVNPSPRVNLASQPVVTPARMPAPREAPAVVQPIPRPFVLPDAPAAPRMAALPSATATQRQPLPQPVMLEPVRMPVVASAPPPQQPAPVQALSAPMPALPAPMPVSRTKHVMAMLQRPNDPRRLETEIDQLTATEIAGQPTVVPALMKAAEEMTDASVRSACLRAIVRGKAATPEVMAGFERLVNDRATAVRIEAAAGLEELRRAQK